MGREQLERVAKLAHSGLDDADVATGFDVMEEFECVLNDVDDEVRVVAASLVLNQLFDSPPQFRIDRRLVPFLHRPGAYRV